MQQNEKIIGTQGWDQFIAGKQEMLYQYELAKKYSKSHIVQTSHGNVAEAVFRKWLESFLPKKYGVSSGYIVSQNERFRGKKLPHYDVIIYDKLNSPTLWVEYNPDNSSPGMTRAIPAEFILGIIEVKSQLTPYSAKKALAKICEIEPLIRLGPVKEFDGLIGQPFLAATVFFELKKVNQFKKTVINNLVKTATFPIYGSVLLSGEGLDVSKTGLLRYASNNVKVDSNVGKGSPKHSLLKGSSMSDSILVLPANRHLHGLLTWGRSQFAIFAFDLIAFLEGTFDNGKISSLYGIAFKDTKK